MKFFSALVAACLSAIAASANLLASDCERASPTACPRAAPESADIAEHTSHQPLPDSSALAIRPPRHYKMTLETCVYAYLALDADLKHAAG